MRNREVAIVLNSLGGGGAEKATVNLINGFISHDIDVHLILLRPKEIIRDELAGEVRISLVPGWLWRLKYIGRLLSVWWFLVRKRSKRVISIGERPNIIVPFAAMLSPTIRKSIIVEHNTKTFLSDPTTYNEPQYFRHIARWAYRRADNIVAISGEVRNAVIKELPDLDSRVHTIHNALDLALIGKKAMEPIQDEHWNKDSRILLNIGRLVPAKDQATLLRAFHILYQKDPAFKLLILGEGEEMQSLKDLVLELELENAVIFRGFQSNPYQYMHQADLLVHSAVFEGLPMVFIEAHACGLPIATTDCNVPYQILLEEEKEAVVPVGDFQRLSQSVESLLECKFDDEKLRSTVQGFSTNIIAKSFLELMEMDLNDL